MTDDQACNRTLDLAQTIARDIANRVAEEFPDAAQQNPSMTLVWGFLAGVAERAHQGAIIKGGPRFVRLFEVGRQMGELVGASDMQITEL